MLPIANPENLIGYVGPPEVAVSDLNQPSTVGMGQSSTREPVALTQQDAPLPTNYTRAWPVGKTFDHAWAHMWRYIPLNIKSTNAIQALHFLVPKVPGAMVVRGVPGRQNPIRERININSPASTAYGNLASVVPPDPSVYANKYLKLM